MTEPEAIDIARWLLVAAGHDLASYTAPRTTHEGDEWFVLFSGTSGAPGDHVSVVLDEQTHQSHVVLGR